MSFVLGMAVLTAIAMVWIYAPAYPEPERHEHMRAMDRLAEETCAGCGRPWTPGRRCTVGGTCWVER